MAQATAKEKAWGLFIDGAWAPAANRATLEVRNPATGAVIAQVPDGGLAEARAAIDAAHRAFPAWSALPAIERGKILVKARDLIMARVDEIARLVTLENGKPVAEAKGEVTFASGYLGWFAEEARRNYGEIVPPPVPVKRLWVIKQPIGVVAAITPWNFPATMVLRKIAPALAAGCTVVLKPAKATPLTAFEIARALEEAGLPKGVFNVVVGRAPEVFAREFVANPKVRKIAFTGSTEVGKELMKGAADQIKRVSFELGGNAPFIVFSDADLDKAAEGAVMIKYLRVGGQSCICANRFYVEQSVVGPFMDRFLARVKALKVGNGLEPGVLVGPLINEATLKKVAGLVDEAVGQGAKVLVGGKRLTDGDLHKGFFYAPTVLSDVKETMRVSCEEIFGPVAPIFTFESEAEVLERANNTEYGLAAYFYARDIGRIHRVGEALEYGLIGVNDASGYVHEIPFGGYKESGLGREGGREGLEEYMEVKSLSVRID